MCVREGKEFEESFPHLGRDGILKSPFNRGRHFKRRRFHFVSFATVGGGRDEGGNWEKEGGAASQVQQKENVPLVAYKFVHFHLKQDFYGVNETVKKGEETDYYVPPSRDKTPDRDRCRWSQLTTSWHFRVRDGG